MISVEDLLRPVSPERPCGEDLSYDARVMNLEAMVEGTGQSQFATEAVEIDWKQVYQESQDILRQSKHLRLALFLTRAGLKREGLSGFVSGLSVMRGFCEQFWPSLYPSLDAEDPNPLERVNIVRDLATREMLLELARVSLTESRAGRFSLQQLQDAKNPPANPEPNAPAASLIDAAFQETPKEAMDKCHAAISQAIDEAKKLSAALDQAVGAANGADLAPLVKKLEEMGRVVAPHTTPKESPAAAAPEASSAAAPAPPPPPPGTINSRADAVKALDKIVEFFEKNEPSSPVPFLLKRAKKCIDMNFLELVHELANARAQAEGVLGKLDQK